MLYVVATPIGNLKDISFRAVETLQSCDLILAENKLVSTRLLKKYEIKVPLITFHKHDEVKREEWALKKLREGLSIGLISDAGTPGICDPGSRLVRRCHREKIPLTVIPGPSATTTALAFYGVQGPFQFLGFLPKKIHPLKIQIANMFLYEGTSIAFISPHNLLRVLKLLPDQKVCLARELTKIHEELLEDYPDKLLTHFQTHPVKGEFVLIVPEEKRTIEKDGAKLMEELQHVFQLERKEALLIAAKLTHIRKKELYDHLHRHCTEK